MEGMHAMRDFVLFYINHTRHRVSGEAIFQPLSDWLRYEQGLVGTKVVCAEGDCGACSALLGRMSGGSLQYQVFNSCIQYLYQLDCQHVVTVEGLKENGQLHPVQQAMIEHFGSQCGYCTPGFVVALAGLFEKQKNLNTQAVRTGLTGNLCRCTGYQPIIEAALSIHPEKIKPLAKRFPIKKMVNDFQQHRPIPIAMEYEETLAPRGTKRYFNPVTLQKASQLKQQHPDAVLIAGGTDISVQMNKDRLDPPTVLSLSNVPGLDTLTLQGKAVTVGAKVCWSELEAFCEKNLPELHKILQVFASDQIKHVGTLAGNIANASPIADSLPFLFVMNADLELSGLQKKRWLPIHEFYRGYKQTALQPDEIITHIRFSLPQPGHVLKLYKVSKRRDLDISTFTAGIYMETQDQEIQQARIAYGGVGPVVLRLTNTEKFLKNKALDWQTMKKAGHLARSEIFPISDVRASNDYRLQLAENILEKFYYEVAEAIPR